MANKRDNLLYRLRKKGVQVNTRERVIFFGVGGEPYKSKQVEIAQLTANEGVGIQKLIFIDNNIMLPVIEYGSGNEFKSMDRYMFAKNDGLSFKDWKAWFRNYNLSNPLAIIHFTNFRY